MGRARVCILCNVSTLIGGVTAALASAQPARRGGVRLVVLEEGPKLEGEGELSGGCVTGVRLSGDFLRDVLNVVKELSMCGKLKVVISDCSPYQACVALTASTIMYERVVELVVRCRLTPYEVCYANAALPHALGGREGRRTRLMIVARTAGKCVPLKDLSRDLGISPETTLRHAYALATANLVRVTDQDGNPLVCGEVSPEIAKLVDALVRVWVG